MKQVKTVENNLTMIGEEISHELGAKMVKDFQDNYPKESIANYIGRNIIENILAQPDCMGIRFYYALNEMGKKTLVYVGIDSEENIITECVGINTSGQLVKEKAIVADRAGDSDSGSWNWWETYVKGK